MVNNAAYIITDSANSISVNTYAIRVLGLICATYCAELTSIGGKAIRKSKYKSGYVTKEGYIALNRDYIRLRTSISVEDQHKCDYSLKKVGIIDFSPDKPDLIKFDLNSYIQVISNDDCDFLTKVKKQVKVLSSSETKEIMLMKKIDSLKKVVIEDNVDITASMYAWIEDLAKADASKLTPATVKEFQQVVMNYAKSNVKAALRIIQIATAQKWTNPVYAIENYEKEVKLLKSNNKPRATTIKVATKDSVNTSKKY